MLERMKTLFESIEKPKEMAGPPEYIIAGLGNPGDKYELTRHNAGFMALDALAAKLGVKVDRIKFKSLCGDAKLCGRRVLLLKPHTFMNLSGEAIRDAAAFYKIPMDHVIVLYDDISLPVGKIRVRPKGSDGGHNGIKNIIYLSGTDVFPRVKIGVGQKPRPDYDLVAWVLGKLPEDQREDFGDALNRTISAVETILNEGTAKAMNDFNA